MSTQKDEILKIIVALKAIKWPVSKIEAELGFSNGLIGKAAKGGTDLSADKMEKLEKFFKEKTGYQEPVKEEKKMVVKSSGKLTLAPSDEAIKKLKEVNEKLNKDFGAGTIMCMGDKQIVQVESISTGSLCLNEAIGIGGFPKGRIIEIYGPESSGKTTIAIHTIAEAQKLGGKCAFIDAEHAFDSFYAQNIGVNMDELFLSQPDYGEQALEIADRCIGSGGYAVVVIDSVAALVPKSELDGQMGDVKMALQARLMSQALRKLTGSISKTNTICIFINQLRFKVGMFMGNPETTAGGEALKFYASVRLDVRKKVLRDGEDAYGNEVRVKVVKNKVAPPFKVAEFDIIYGEGIDTYKELITLASEKGVITKSGSWYSYNNDKLGQGAEAVKLLLKDNEELYNEIYQKTITSTPLE